MKKKGDLTVIRIWNYWIFIWWWEAIKLHKITCCYCSYAKECEYAFDTYNTDGDCLEEK